MGHTQPAPTAHGPAPAAPAAHPGGRMHLTVAVILAVLTIIAFAAVWSERVPVGDLVPGLLILAVAQIALQTLYYMRLRVDSRKFALFFCSGVLLAILISTIVHVLLSAR